MKFLMERFGVFLFKHRNLVFPLVIVAEHDHGLGRFSSNSPKPFS